MIDCPIDRTEMTADEIADVIWLTLLRESMSRSEIAEIDAEANVSESRELSPQLPIENTDPNLLDLFPLVFLEEDLHNIFDKVAPILINLGCIVECR